MNEMNFDNKHLIRWGLPGWVFLIFVTIYILIKEPSFVGKLNEKDDIPIIGLLALLGGLGVPIGYLIHQISIFLGFIIFTNQEKYFQEEYTLDRIFSKHDKGSDFRKRYVHFLTRVHEVRGLMFSCLLSFIVILGLEFFKFGEFDTSTKVIMVANVTLLAISYANQRYYTNNLDFYVNKMMHYQRDIL